VSPAAQTVLVVDDDPTVSDVVRRYLERAGLRVVLAADGQAALEAAREHRPDLVVLDLMLPGLSGLEVATRLRQRSDVPIVMLTALGEEHDRVVGLEHGADDYVTKPFSPRELVLRVLSVLRRASGGGTGAAGGAGAAAGGAVAGSGPGGGTGAGAYGGVPSPVPGSTVLVDGDLVLDAAARTVRRGGRPLTLTVREFDLLAHLLRHPRRAFTRTELLAQVWGWTFGDQTTVTVHVRRLREKVEPDPAAPQRIVTVWGVGYRYDPAGAREEVP